MRTNSTLRERLGVYILGVAIGLMIMGMIFMARYQAHLAREAERAGSAASAPAVPDARDDAPSPLQKGE